MKKTFKWKLAQRLEKKWWQNYLRKKSPSDYLKWKAEYWLNLLGKCKTILPINDQLKALDAGCGPAGIFMILANCEVTAVDPLLADYQWDLSHFDPAAYPWVDFLSVAFEDYNTEEQFDLVFSMNAINHFSDLQFSVRKLCEVLKKEGYLIVTIDAHNHQWAKRALRLMPLDALHPHQYDDLEYIAMFEKNGCTLLEHLRYQQAYLFDHHLFIFQKN